MITPESYEKMRIAHDRVVAAQEGGQERLAAEEALRRLLWESRATIIQAVEPQPNRYWEGRWRDEAAENDRLNKQLRRFLARDGRLVAALQCIRISNDIRQAQHLATTALNDTAEGDAGRGSAGGAALDVRNPAPPRRDSDGGREADDS
jgi:hypothetical protein